MIFIIWTKTVESFFKIRTVPLDDALCNLRFLCIYALSLFDFHMNALTVYTFTGRGATFDSFMFAYFLRTSEDIWRLCDPVRTASDC